MPHLDRILETALYVDNLDRASVFYQNVMGLEPMFASGRMRSYDIQGQSVLLLFVRGGTPEPIEEQSGTIPPHDGQGQLHIAFGCGHAALEDWDRHLTQQDVRIEGRMTWTHGGKSIFFRDPDDNLLEIAASPGLWPGY